MKLITREDYLNKFYVPKIVAVNERMIKNGRKPLFKDPTDLKACYLWIDKLLEFQEVEKINEFLDLMQKLGFKNETDKYDVKLFVDILLQRIVECCRKSTETKYTLAYMLTSELKKKLAVKNLDYKAQFEKYLINLRSIMKGE